MAGSCQISQYFASKCILPNKTKKLPMMFFKMTRSKDATFMLKRILAVSFRENSKICDSYGSHNTDM